LHRLIQLTLWHSVNVLSQRTLKPVSENWFIRNWIVTDLVDCALDVRPQLLQMTTTNELKADFQNSEHISYDDDFSKRTRGNKYLSTKRFPRQTYARIIIYSYTLYIIYEINRFDRSMYRCLQVALFLWAARDSRFGYIF